MTMPNVFISGFERSGTTLLRRLVSMWPGYDKDLIHEQRKLLTYGTRQEAENNYYDEYSHILCGEKIPYFNNSDFIIQYIQQFRRFWPDSLIFHILRKPEDVALSCKRTFHKPTNFTLDAYYKHVQLMLDYLKEEDNVITIVYESLIQKPTEIVKLIYERLGTCPEDWIIKQIITTKESWFLEEKRMCGLRYSDSVGRIKH